MSASVIRVQGAREHNLKGITVEIPRDKLVVITGVSGSGKSSLAFDTIYAEGQRRYVESLSAYARQFLGQMEKPDVDLIEGLSPAISIEQKTTHRNPRSTVGTVTEIYDYFRLLFARAGVQHCHNCGRKIQSVGVDQIVDMVQTLSEGSKLQILSPLISGSKGEHKDVIEQARKDGFVRLRINGEVRDLSEDITLAKNRKHDIEIVVDRIVLKPAVRSRLAEALETALEKSGGMVLVNDGHEDRVYSRKSTCTHCNLSLPELSPRSFSFNSPHGACSKCDGLGVLLEFDEDLVVSDPEQSILDGAMAAWGSSKSYWFIETVHNLGKKLGFEPNTPYEKIPEKIRSQILHGTPGKGKFHFEGVLPSLKRRYMETKSDDVRIWLERYMSEKPCPSCKGKRLRPESLSVKFHSETIDSISEKNIRDILQFFEGLKLHSTEEKIAGRIIKEIRERLSFLHNVGVGYLNLSRSAGTLSGGEAQRIRLATQIGSSLMGVLYILDEPSIGLHQRDNDRLLSTLCRLRDLGNTVIVVEHDEDTIRAADHVIDIGPGAGLGGGRVVGEGRPEDLIASPESITGMYLSGKRKIDVPATRREGNGKKLVIRRARENNLKGIDVEIPLGKLIAVTGVSGSGKSTLVNDILYEALAAKIGEGRHHPGKHDRITGVEALDRVICIDQEPIGRTPRSNPATYTGLFTPIRDLFSRLPEAKVRGYAPGRFSFNVAGGRCENCEGAGIITIEMHFLPDVYVTCDVCKGKRFNRETLEVKFHGKNIHDVLDLTVDDGVEFFRNIPLVARKLETLQEVGLGYIRLGQAATTLSGGEAQRVKLATELSKKSTGRTLYILDEPTTGLHFEDISRLLSVLHSLVERGNSMVIIEHNLDVIKTADHLIDLGPEGGDEGGQIIAEGTPEEVAANPASHTGKYLGQILARGRKSA
ncbi:MAG TPA: excinuclease ABC subunit UvrA [Leptospiraceae bacterium]|nr:excinuclease ABC subunit UvrA [Leptospirales bacterium]HMX56389.1 excinuclease ABC subunit UvrA [Leptospiraceae bacterium]HNN58036.1 excinuclease ABC subunit UvrA [Leptospiraceae bacterium]HQI18371.1 excinuclease ABC subunit UvrA [Leptospiraceae bacterium]